jgi:hypothetical protein
LNDISCDFFSIYTGILGYCYMTGHSHFLIYLTAVLSLEYIQGVSGGILNILGGGSMDCSE